MCSSSSLELPLEKYSVQSNVLFNMMIFLCIVWHVSLRNGRFLMGGGGGV